MNLKSLFVRNESGEELEKFIRKRAPIRSVPSNFRPALSPRVTGNHVYLEVGSGKPVIFCPGLFGGFFNISDIAQDISATYRLLMPFLPMYDLALKDCSMQVMADYLHSFVVDLDLDEVVLIGSSMGGGVSLNYALNREHRVKGMVLCGSSGLSNIPLSTGFLKRKNLDFIRESARDIYFDREIAPDEMVDDVFRAIQNYDIALRAIRFTRAATGNQLHDVLPSIDIPTLLVWGKQDPITPAQVGMQFADLLPDARLHILDECGHIPTQEKPGEFLALFSDFLERIKY